MGLKTTTGLLVGSVMVPPLDTYEYPRLGPSPLPVRLNRALPTTKVPWTLPGCVGAKFRVKVKLLPAVRVWGNSGAPLTEKPAPETEGTPAITPVAFPVFCTCTMTLLVLPIFVSGSAIGPGVVTG